MKALVSKCLEGRGLDALEVASRQSEIFRLLNAVYMSAMIREETQRSQIIASGSTMVKVSKKRGRGGG